MFSLHQQFPTKGAHISYDDGNVLGLVQDPPPTKWRAGAVKHPKSEYLYMGCCRASCMYNEQDPVSGLSDDQYFEVHRPLEINNIA